MKSRHPERFSDSAQQDFPVLDRSLLEYHLDTLTSRAQELHFETFARRLLERTVCPNLLPHTGPTGGGDSKVDSETYPVAEALALGWCIGLGNEAATERWGFAFSAKKDWRPKLKSDISKIVATGRGYTKAFFVTSQHVPDRKRAECEDQLRSKHGLDVRIFDRTWLLDTVFGARLENLAIDELSLQTSVRRQLRRGPLDGQREQDLQDVQARIAAALQDRRHGPTLVSDCLEAADLARGLERPRTETDGLYERADRLAMQFGTLHQGVQSAYDRAWTSFWWHEDYYAFAEQYRRVEERACESSNVYDLELLTNLFFLLHRALIECGALDADGVDLQAHATALIAGLERLAQEQARPSTALQARTLHLLVDLLLVEADKRASILSDLVDVVHNSEGLVGYPLNPLVQIIVELGSVMGSQSAYDDLFQAVVQTTTRRTGEVSAARLLVTRGAQQLDAGQRYEAIRTLGSTFGALHKYESRHDEIHALYLCARAYEQVGLVWAARGTMLVAASLATNELWTHDQITPQQLACYHSIKWMEVRLGRIPQILMWHEVDQYIHQALLAQGCNMNHLAEEEQAFDAIVGMLLLYTDLRDLRNLTGMPDVLEGLALPFASVALTYALGHEDEVPRELFGDAESPDAMYQFFRMWRDQPAAKDIPSKPVLYTQRTVVLASNVLCCKIIIDCSNNSPCIELVESMLAAIESFLATSVIEKVMSAEPTLTIKVRPTDFGNWPFTFETSDDDGQPHIEIRCPMFNPHQLSVEEQQRLKGRLLELVSHVIGRAFVMHDP